MMKEGVLGGALVLVVLSCLFFVVCFSSGGVFYLLFGFALICTILCWDPINNKKNNEPPLQKKKIMEPINQKKNSNPPLQKKKIMEPINKNKNAVPKEIKISTLSSCSMTYRTLQLNIISAEDLKDVNLFSKMFVFAAVSISDEPYIRTITTTCHGRNPVWNFPVKFTVNESLANNNGLFLKVKLLSCNKFLPWNTTIGTVFIPIKELLDNPAAAGHQLSYQVRKKPSAKSKGTLNLSYKFGDRVKVPATKKVAKIKNDEWYFTGNGYSAVLPSFALSTDDLCSYDHSHHFSLCHH